MFKKNVRWTFCSNVYKAEKLCDLIEILFYTWLCPAQLMKVVAKLVMLASYYWVTQFYTFQGMTVSKNLNSFSG